MTSTTTMIILLSMMLAFNIGMAFVQSAMLEVNPSGEQFFDVSKSPYANYVVNGTLVVDETLLPADDTVEGDVSGNIFSDTYKNIKSWTRQKLAPLNFVSNILKQPYGFLKDLGMPESMALAIGTFWYLIAIIIMVSWWMGR